MNEKEEKAEEATPSPEELLAECEKKKEEYFSGWQREKADFINYKKGEMERLEEVLFSAKESLVLKIIPVLDNFDLAERAIPGKDKEDKNVKGMLLIKKQLLETLKAMGLKEIDCLGQKFDPEKQEAIGEIEKKDAEPGTVVEEVEKGYELNGQVIRPAKVRIGK
jgi:molecular chaperone GrpE